ncbi:hypothetical protein LFM09_24520 [Lentzea alba]|uniref:hypothetical protein n=1 Tax=Lentzea alba TaxID=2714351 RepID=UPI0039BF085D
MKNTIKIAIVAAIAAVGLAACTSAPESEQSAARLPQTQTSTPGTSAPPPSVVTEVVTSTVTNPPKPQAVTGKIDKTDDRLGYGAFKLGMTLEEARAAGLTNLSWDGEGDNLCVADDKIAVSKSHGIERITLPADAKTSKGIGVGSTFAEVKRAYPNATEYRAGWFAVISSIASYSFSAYSSSDTDKVEQIKLTSRLGSCPLAYM